MAVAAASSPRVRVMLRPGSPGVERRFLAYAAHELRTPLATQRALLELALADPTTDVGCWREIGEDVLRACRQQERLLEACLVLARSRSKARRSEPVDLAAVAAEVLRAHDVGELARVVELEPAWTTGDPDLLERLASNLITNAVRHNRPHGRIEIATRRRQARVHLTVANTGPAIPSGELGRLFRPFQRFTSPLTSAAEGVGLGLAIVRAIADAHDATVSARALAGGGLRIDIAFPALA